MVPQFRFSGAKARMALLRVALPLLSMSLLSLLLLLRGGCCHSNSATAATVLCQDSTAAKNLELSPNHSNQLIQSRRTASSPLASSEPAVIAIAAPDYEHRNGRRSPAGGGVSILG
ncbi:hypothetical protein COCSADRAFT_352768 [Bipolaris sorokiniana ND90Pr]|uniref:Uncharacterized protein n=1 Tax=Cochliobolus sativus (strain ND90Pr / ATCC 201652) TaxID=665912 RepID=M2SKR6_COCSN|nr:uncharacterized protein COCSADRAFT_352768 [Bipolaris sorokiniana ND90Pr]EMD67763.1 hypothetical protein COCSADRAFT_352768 [Bipolaris sorokiniana ND90Pr]